MNRFFERYQTSITFKVLILTGAVSFVVFALLCVITQWWQEKTMLDGVRSDAARGSRFVSMLVEEPMRVGDDETTRAHFATLGRREKDTDIYMVDYAGDVTYSTRKDAEGKNISAVLPDSASRAQIAGSLKARAETGDLVQRGGSQIYSEVKTIPNEPACHHCHGASRPILGALITEQNLDARFASLRESRFVTAGLSLAGMAGLCMALFVFFDRTIIRRIRKLEGSADAVRQGNLEASFAVGGRDRLADLAGHLAAMVTRIKDQLEYNKGLLDGISVPLFVADRRGRLSFVNAPLRTIIGKSEKELLGKSVAEVFYAGADKAAKTDQVLAGGVTAAEILRYRRADGVEFPLHSAFSPLKNARGETVGVVAVLVDLPQEEKARRRIESDRRNLLDVANEVTAVAGKLEQSCGSLSDQMTSLTKAMDSAADRTTQVATAMEEMNSTITEVAKNAGDTASASGKANGVAREGGEMVKSTIEEIGGVSATTQDLFQALHQLSESAKNIGQVMGVINDIADQTNLLALNAAIEAARAGDAGRGFAVVADAVRKLAEKSMSATKQVAEAVGIVRKNTTDAMGQMDEAKKRVDRTTGLADGAGGKLTQIVSTSNNIADMVRSIATAAEEQSAASEEINGNLSGINELSTQMSQDIQKANAGIREVAGMSRDLSRLVEKFRSAE